MGIDDPGQTTYYWSYTNLAASGKLVLGNVESKVSGKAWFDKQGGTYSIINRWTHWEWFSLRFLDDEEVMLFSFPQDDYRDGTFIDRAGKTRRLTDYSVTPLGFTTAGGKKFLFRMDRVSARREGGGVHHHAEDGRSSSISRTSSCSRT